MAQSVSAAIGKRIGAMATLRMLFALFFATAASLKAPTSRLHPTWAPQDLTRDNAGFAPIPEDDYVKQYERNQALWPVEFFVIVYRRIRDGTAEVLVRRSANGTSKYGVGTGAPATRWILSSQEAPRGYAKTGLSFAASTCVEINQCVGCTHFSAMTRPSWLGRAVRNQHRHAIEQASRRWREHAVKF